MYIHLFRYYMQVYAKCNQNCVKIAGNPRDSRRFRVSRDFTECLYMHITIIIMMFRLLFIALPCLEALITTMSPYRTQCLCTTTPSTVLKCVQLQPSHPSCYGWMKMIKVKNTTPCLIFMYIHGRRKASYYCCISERRLDRGWERYLYHWRKL